MNAQRRFAYTVRSKYNVNPRAHTPNYTDLEELNFESTDHNWIRQVAAERLGQYHIHFPDNQFIEFGVALGINNNDARVTLLAYSPGHELNGLLLKHGNIGRAPSFPANWIVRREFFGRDLQDMATDDLRRAEMQSRVFWAYLQRFHDMRLKQDRA
jgi:hypothetical protein